jgi:hypothetical protein
MEIRSQTCPGTDRAVVFHRIPAQYWLEDFCKRQLYYRQLGGHDKANQE